MENEKTTKKSIKNIDSPINLSPVTVKDLKEILNNYLDTDKISIWDNYQNYDLVLCCNLEHQKENNIIMFTLGLVQKIKQ